MSSSRSANMKSIATGVMVGSLAFMATKAMTSNKKTSMKKATGKALKAVGTVIEAFQG